MKLPFQLCLSNLGGNKVSHQKSCSRHVLRSPYCQILSQWNQSPPARIKCLHPVTTSQENVWLERCLITKINNNPTSTPFCCLDVQGYWTIIQLDEVDFAFVCLHQPATSHTKTTQKQCGCNTEKGASRAVFTQPQTLTLGAMCCPPHGLDRLVQFGCFSKSTAVCPTMLLPISSAATMRLISVRPPTQLLYPGKMWIPEHRICSVRPYLTKLLQKLSHQS